MSTGMSAGPAWIPDTSHSGTDTDTASSSASVSDAVPGPYEEGGLVTRDHFGIQPGDFVRYLKEDGVIYQGYVMAGTPAENGFDEYDGYEDDLAVELKYDDGRHVAPIPIQQVSDMTVKSARERTAFGRNVETVSPAELIAISPDNQRDWYRFREAWNPDTDELTLTPDDL